MGEILSYELLNNTIQTWLSFLLTTSAALAIAYLFKRLLILNLLEQNNDTRPRTVVDMTSTNRMVFLGSQVRIWN